MSCKGSLLKFFHRVLLVSLEGGIWGFTVTHKFVSHGMMDGLLTFFHRVPLVTFQGGLSWSFTVSKPFDS